MESPKPVAEVVLDAVKMHIESIECQMDHVKAKAEEAQKQCDQWRDKLRVLENEGADCYGFLEESGIKTCLDEQGAWQSRYASARDQRIIKILSDRQSRST